MLSSLRVSCQRPCAPLLAGLWLLTAASIATQAQSPSAASEKVNEDRMSAMGRLATRAREAVEERATAERSDAPKRAGLASPPPERQDDDVCVNDPRCPAGLREGPSGGQAELSIAIDDTLRFVVIGFNDQRGFSRNPLSVSGFMYSTDGGVTFTDGGSLPVTVATSTIGPNPTLYPQVFGDPDVKYLGGCTFVYSSIVVKKYTATGVAQTMGVHRSTDCGRTWQGPYEVEAATNPNGFVTVGGSAVDAADKEFIDVDLDTGRLIMTWANFTPFARSGVEIRSAVSDDGGLTWPAAQGRIVSATAADGQGSIPRFARGSQNVYVAWQRYPFPGTFGGLGNTVAFARSVDDGATWQPPIELSPEFITMDQVLGNDRVHSFPSLAVDRSGGFRNGSVYVVHANNNSLDGADIVFYTSTDQGQTFTELLVLNSRPGNDRAQWFPWVTVDDVTGRVSVFYYDQGIATSGHLSEVTYTFSNDGGATWSPPRPLTDRPFKAGHGNDTSQPNLGDYNQAVAVGGRTWSAFSLASRPPGGFADGQPSASMTVPDAVVRIVSPAEHLTPYATLQSRSVSTTVTGRNRFADPGETVRLELPLFNYVSNPLNQRSIRIPVGFLKTATPGVDVVWGVSLYPNIAPGETQSSYIPFSLRLSSTFETGTPIELELHVISFDGFAVLKQTIFTGTPIETTLLSEDFEGVGPGALPTGWTTAHGGGANIIPWTTSNSFCGGLSNGAFHQNANDNPGGSPVRWERLFSPSFTVPEDAEYVLLEFDVCYDTEEDPNFRVLAYDGFFLRIADLTPGQTLRSVLVEAFEDQFRTGRLQHYPRHFPRSSNRNYFQDMSAWAGDSRGVRRVRLRLPGMQGRTAQLRFEFTQDTALDCKAIRPGSPECGVFVDNISLTSVVSRGAVMLTP